MCRYYSGGYKKKPLYFFIFQIALLYINSPSHSDQLDQMESAMDFEYKKGDAFINSLDHENQQDNEEPEFHESNKRFKRVIDGEPSYDKEYVVKIIASNSFKEKHCTGSFVGLDWVITAKECFNDFDNPNINVKFLSRAIEYTQFTLEAEEYYESDTTDFALVRLPISSRQQNQPTLPISMNLATPTDDISSVWIFGYGNRSGKESATKRQVVVNSVDYNQNNIYLRVGHNDDQATSDNPRSAVSENDMGGPLIYNRELIAILDKIPEENDYDDYARYTSIANQKRFILETMGLSWYSYTDFLWILHLRPPKLFSTSQHSEVCRVLEVNRHTSRSYLGSTVIEGNARKCKYYSGQASRWKSSRHYEAAYHPNINGFKQHHKAEWHSLEFLWEKVTENRLPDRAIPFAHNSKGHPQYACVKIQENGNPWEAGQFPGTLDGERDDSFPDCRNLAPGSDQGDTYVMVYSPDPPTTDNNWQLVWNSHPQIPGNVWRHVHGSPCWRAEGNQLRIGALEAPDKKSANSVDCRINNTVYSTYQTLKADLLKNKQWNGQNNQHTSFYGFHEGALGATDYYSKPTINRPFCRFTGDQYGLVYSSECRTADGNTSSEYELFSDAPFNEGIERHPAPDWQMIISAENTETSEPMYCNGIKLNNSFILTGWDCIKDLPENTDYRFRTIDNHKEYSAGQVLRLESENNNYANKLVLLTSRDSIDHIPDAPLIASTDWDIEGLKPSYRDYNRLPASIRLLYSAQGRKSSTEYRSLRQSLFSEVEGSPGIRYDPSNLAYSLHDLDGSKSHEFPLRQSRPSIKPSGLVDTKDQDISYIPTSSAVIMKNTHHETLLMGLTYKEANNRKSTIVPAHIIQKALEPYTLTSKLTSNHQEGLVIENTAPCWITSSASQMMGYVRNGHCHISIEGILVGDPNFYLLPDVSSNEKQYQWVYPDDRGVPPKDAVVIFDEGVAAVITEDSHNKLGSESLASVPTTSRVLTLAATNLKKPLIDQLEWLTCHSSEWPCHDKNLFTAKHNKEESGVCTFPLHLEWQTGLMIKNSGNRCEANPSGRDAVHQETTKVMKKPRFYQHYNIEPEWSGMSADTLGSSLLRLKDEQGNEQYICKQSPVRKKSDASSEEELCRVTFQYPSTRTTYKKLLKHYPPDEEHYPGWKHVIQGENADQIEREAWLRDGSNDSKHICLKVDVVTGIVHLGYLEGHDRRYCKASLDEKTSSYSDKKKHWRDYMVLLDRPHKWVIKAPNTPLPENAVIAQRHPQKGGESEYVCKVGTSHKNYRLGRTSLDQKVCLIDNKEVRGSFWVLVDTSPSASTFNTANSNNYGLQSLFMAPFIFYLLVN